MRTVYLKNGRTEVVTDPEKDLRALISDALGADCENLYIETLNTAKYHEGDDYEAIADGYYNALSDAADRLSEILDTIKTTTRLNRDKLYQSLHGVYQDIVRNYI